MTKLAVGTEYDFTIKARGTITKRANAAEEWGTTEVVKVCLEPIHGFDLPRTFWAHEGEVVEHRALTAAPRFYEGELAHIAELVEAAAPKEHGKRNQTTIQILKKIKAAIGK